MARPCAAAKPKWTSSSSPLNLTPSSVGRTTRCPACRRRSARRSEFEQSSRYRLRATGNRSPLDHQPLDLRFGLKQLPVARDIGEGLAYSLDGDMVIGCRRFLVELVRLHRPDELPGRHVSPFDVELLSPGMLTADHILPRLDGRLAHLFPVDLLLQTAKTALNRVEAVGGMGGVLCHVLAPARITRPW